jgi:putative NIF3 family GTP cyclohydrolase 1 type 2
MGEKLSLIVIGHSASEEGGSEFMAEWLTKNILGVKVYHVPSSNSLQVL